MLKNIEVGYNPPDDINVIIEIPTNNEPVKYEFNKTSEMLVVDRFMSTNMHYPCNYGFIPNTLSDDGDPIDVLVIAPVDLRPGVLINCKPVGVLKMTDESGRDSKIISVPSTKLTKEYETITDINDIPELLLKKIKHFFEHYKDLDPHKWVKVESFQGVKEAKSEILSSISNYQK